MRKITKDRLSETTANHHHHLHSVMARLDRPLVVGHRPPSRTLDYDRSPHAGRDFCHLGHRPLETSQLGADPYDASAGTECRRKPDCSTCLCAPAAQLLAVCEFVCAVRHLGFGYLFPEPTSCPTSLCQLERLACHAQSFDTGCFYRPP